MIQWPCVFKLDGDDELLYLATELELKEAFAELIWSDDDFLLDSAGQTYRVQLSSKKGHHYQRLARCLSVDDVTALVQAHEFAKAEVCLVKIQFLTVQQAIASLAPRSCSPDVL